ncbi:hypothetical protein ABFS82_12G144300 [Erythranthe guttata]
MSSRIFTAVALLLLLGLLVDGEGALNRKLMVEKAGNEVHQVAAERESSTASGDLDTNNHHNIPREYWNTGGQNQNAPAADGGSADNHS